MQLAPLIPTPAVSLGKMRVFRTEHFPASPQTPWLDRADWRERLDAARRGGGISAVAAAHCAHWAEHGFLIIPGLFSAARLDHAWAAYERQIAAGVLTPQEDHAMQSSSQLPGRVLNPHFAVEPFNDILADETVQALVSLLLGVEALPFQTIAGHKGSEQLAHSDAIHMTTYPQGYLAANWIAFEDIAPDAGPLVYYPGSHRLAYTYTKQCGISLQEGQSGYAAYHAKYEPFVQTLIDTNNLRPEYFLAKKGDALFWHANLLHGGSRIENAARSRRALVCHYFAEGPICYHDYTGAPSQLVRLPLLATEEFDGATYLRLNPDVAAAGIDPFFHYTNYGFSEGRRDR